MWKNFFTIRVTALEEVAQTSSRVSFYGGIKDLSVWLPVQPIVGNLLQQRD